VSRHWWELQEAFGARHPIDLGCFSTTVELRGEADVTHEWAEQDALGMLRFLALRGHLRESAVSRAPPEFGTDCVALPLEGVDPLTAPVGGIVVFTRPLGEAVAAGDVMAEIIDPLSGAVTAVASRVDGVFFAHSKTRWALRGERIGKVAGSKAFRSGKLLSL
jgi:predicted deacylase